MNGMGTQRLRIDEDRIGTDGDRWSETRRGTLFAVTVTKVKAEDDEYAHGRNTQTVTAQDGTAIGLVYQSEVTFDRQPKGCRYVTSRTSSLRWFHNGTRSGWARSSWYETKKATVEALIANELREGKITAETLGTIPDDYRDALPVRDGDTITVHPGPTIRDDDSDDVYTLESPLTVFVRYARVGETTHRIRFSVPGDGTGSFSCEVPLDGFDLVSRT